MDIRTPQQFSHEPPAGPPAPPTMPGGGLDALARRLIARFKRSAAFPILSIAVLLVVILGLGFAVVGLVQRFGGAGPRLKGAPQAQNVAYRISGTAELKLSVLSASYQDTYNDMKPLAPDRKLAVVSIEVRNEGTAQADPLTREDIRLIAPDGSILPPASFSAGFLNIALGPREKRRGDVVWDVDPRNNVRPLSDFQIALGKNPGSRALYPLAEKR